MTPRPIKEQNLFEFCRLQMSGVVPQLREAINEEDDSAIPVMVRDLRNTLGLLRLPMLFQLSQEIEYQRETLDRSVWLLRCEHFCDLIERIHLSIQQQLGEN